MRCFSLAVIQDFLIWLVVIAALFAILRVVLSYANPPEEMKWILDLSMQIVKIILWAVLIIFVIVIVFSLLACALPIRL